MPQLRSPALNKQLLVLMFAFGTLGLVGCQEQTPAVSPADENNAPAAKFAQFAAELRRRCQESSGSLVADDPADLGTTSVRTVIDLASSAWHAPQSPGGNYTAEVTIVTHLSYASSSPIEVSAAEPSRLTAPGKKKPQLEDEDAEETIDATANTPVRRLGRQEEFRDTYDLVYRNDRWELESREIPESIQLLLNRALEAQ